MSAINTRAATPTKDREPGLMHRSLIDRPLQVVSGSGIYLTLADGSRILDGCCGAAVSVIGHGNRQVQEAIMRQYSDVAYVHSMAYTTSSAEELADQLTELSRPFGLTKAYFVCSGSEAMDAAMKLARQYHFENGQPQRRKFVARRQAYHGNTIGAMSVSSNLPRKIPYDGALVLDTVSFVSPAYAYHGQLDGETEEEYADRLVQELDDEFRRVGPETVIAFVAETVGGATAACITAPRGYFRGVRRVCDRYGILLILDEVMCGSGRTGAYFAFEREGDVRPDLLTLGKGLGGGYAPIAGVLVSQRVVNVLKRGTASFVHGHTYQAHPTSCAAALAVQRVIKRDDLVAECLVKGAFLEQRLRSVLGGAKHVGEIRGRGLFLGIEYVRDKASRQSFKPEVKFGKKVHQAAHRRGLAIYPGSGTVDGIHGDHSILAPPLTITEEELEELVRLLKEAYDAAEAQLAL
ncbi:ornithine aminotransferase [Trichoderma cornu-damae]|uniref:Ornithine aminotransferase n=1 Tax=Trichoderma cornu-damae TaxID=654480 RepID=A0A9P8QFM3_9HYPO|nr:ornithine aminotransferase [Trichoderma cornu-damae]